MSAPRGTSWDKDDDESDVMNTSTQSNPSQDVKLAGASVPHPTGSSSQGPSPHSHQPHHHPNRSHPKDFTHPHHPPPGYYPVMIGGYPAFPLPPGHIPPGQPWTQQPPHSHHSPAYPPQLPQTASTQQSSQRQTSHQGQYYGQSHPPSQNFHHASPPTLSSQKLPRVPGTGPKTKKITTGVPGDVTSPQNPHSTALRQNTSPSSWGPNHSNWSGSGLNQPPQGLPPPQSLSQHTQQPPQRSMSQKYSNNPIYQSSQPRKHRHAQLEDDDEEERSWEQGYPNQYPQNDPHHFRDQHLLPPQPLQQSRSNPKHAPPQSSQVLPPCHVDPSYIPLTDELIISPFYSTGYFTLHRTFKSTDLLTQTYPHVVHNKAQGPGQGQFNYNLHEKQAPYVHSFNPSALSYSGEILLSDVNIGNGFDCFKSFLPVSQSEPHNWSPKNKQLTPSQLQHATTLGVKSADYLAMLSFVASLTYSSFVDKNSLHPFLRHQFKLLQGTHHAGNDDDHAVLYNKINVYPQHTGSFTEDFISDSILEQYAAIKSSRNETALSTLPIVYSTQRVPLLAGHQAIVVSLPNHQFLTHNLAVDIFSTIPPAPGVRPTSSATSAHTQLLYSHNQTHLAPLLNSSSTSTLLTQLAHQLLHDNMVLSTTFPPDAVAPGASEDPRHAMKVPVRGRLAIDPRTDTVYFVNVEFIPAQLNHVYNLSQIAPVVDHFIRAQSIHPRTGLLAFDTPLAECLNRRSALSRYPMLPWVLFLVPQQIYLDFPQFGIINKLNVPHTPDGPIPHSLPHPKVGTIAPIYGIKFDYLPPGVEKLTNEQTSTKQHEVSERYADLVTNSFDPMNQYPSIFFKNNTSTALPHNNNNSKYILLTEIVYSLFCDFLFEYYYFRQVSTDLEPLVEQPPTAPHNNTPLEQLLELPEQPKSVKPNITPGIFSTQTLMTSLYDLFEIPLQKRVKLFTKEQEQQYINSPVTTYGAYTLLVTVSEFISHLLLPYNINSSSFITSPFLHAKYRNLSLLDSIYYDVYSIPHTKQTVDPMKHIHARLHSNTMNDNEQVVQFNFPSVSSIFTIQQQSKVGYQHTTRAQSPAISCQYANQHTPVQTNTNNGINTTLFHAALPNSVQFHQQDFAPISNWTNNTSISYFNDTISTNDIVLFTKSFSLIPASHPAAVPQLHQATPSALPQYPLITAANISLLRPDYNNFDQTSILKQHNPNNNKQDDSAFANRQLLISLRFLPIEFSNTHEQYYHLYAKKYIETPSTAIDDKYTDALLSDPHELLFLLKQQPIFPLFPYASPLLSYKTITQTNVLKALTDAAPSAFANYLINNKATVNTLTASISRDYLNNHLRIMSHNHHISSTFLFPLLFTSQSQPSTPSPSGDKQIILFHHSKNVLALPLNLRVLGAIVGYEAVSAPNGALRTCCKVRTIIPKETLINLNAFYSSFHPAQNDGENTSKYDELYSFFDIYVDLVEIKYSVYTNHAAGFFHSEQLNSTSSDLHSHNFNDFSSNKSIQSLPHVYHDENFPVVCTNYGMPPHAPLQPYPPIGTLLSVALLPRFQNQYFQLNFNEQVNILSHTLKDQMVYSPQQNVLEHVSDEIHRQNAIKQLSITLQGRRAFVVNTGEILPAELGTLYPSIASFYDTFSDEFLTYLKGKIVYYQKSLKEQEERQNQVKKQEKLLQQQKKQQAADRKAREDVLKQQKAQEEALQQQKVQEEALKQQKQHETALKKQQAEEEALKLQQSVEQTAELLLQQQKCPMGKISAIGATLVSSTQNAQDNSPSVASLQAKLLDLAQTTPISTPIAPLVSTSTTIPQITTLSHRVFFFSAVVAPNTSPLTEDSYADPSQLERVPTTQLDVETVYELKTTSANPLGPLPKMVNFSQWLSSNEVSVSILSATEITSLAQIIVTNLDAISSFYNAVQSAGKTIRYTSSTEKLSGKTPMTIIVPSTIAEENDYQLRLYAALASRRRPNMPALPFPAQSYVANIPVAPGQGRSDFQSIIPLFPSLFPQNPVPVSFLPYHLTHGDNLYPIQYTPALSDIVQSTTQVKRSYFPIVGDKVLFSLDFTRAPKRSSPSIIFPYKLAFPQHTSTHQYEDSQSPSPSPNFSVLKCTVKIVEEDKQVLHMQQLAPNGVVCKVPISQVLVPFNMISLKPDSPLYPFVRNLLSTNENTQCISVSNIISSYRASATPNTPQLSAKQLLESLSLIQTASRTPVIKLVQATSHYLTQSMLDCIKIALSTPDGSQKSFPDLSPFEKNLLYIKNNLVYTRGLYTAPHTRASLGRVFATIDMRTAKWGGDHYTLPAKLFSIEYQALMHHVFGTHDGVDGLLEAFKANNINHYLLFKKGGTIYSNITVLSSDQALLQLLPTPLSAVALAKASAQHSKTTELYLVQFDLECDNVTKTLYLRSPTLVHAPAQTNLLLHTIYECRKGNNTPAFDEVVQKFIAGQALLNPQQQQPHKAKQNIQLHQLIAQAQPVAVTQPIVAKPVIVESATPVNDLNTTPTIKFPPQSKAKATVKPKPQSDTPSKQVMIESKAEVVETKPQTIEQTRVATLAKSAPTRLKKVPITRPTPPKSQPTPQSPLPIHISTTAIPATVKPAPVPTPKIKASTAALPVTTSAPVSAASVITEHKEASTTSVETAKTRKTTQTPHVTKPETSSAPITIKESAQPLIIKESRTELHLPKSSSKPVKGQKKTIQASIVPKVLNKIPETEETAVIASESSSDVKPNLKARKIATLSIAAPVTAETVVVPHVPTSTVATTTVGSATLSPANIDSKPKKETNTKPRNTKPVPKASQQKQESAQVTDPNSPNFIASTAKIVPTKDDM